MELIEPWTRVTDTAKTWFSKRCLSADDGVEAARDAELERRIEKADRGEVRLLDWNAVKGEIAHALKRY
jgi:hypothetical protein